MLDTTLRPFSTIGRHQIYHVVLIIAYFIICNYGLDVKSVMFQCQDHIRKQVNFFGMIFFLFFDRGLKINKLKSLHILLIFDIMILHLFPCTVTYSHLFNIFYGSPTRLIGKYKFYTRKMAFNKFPIRFPLT